MRLKDISLLLAVATIAFLASPIRAGGIPDLVLPEGVGVNIHFTRGHAQDLDMIAAAGFKFVREDFFWGAVERKKGEYDWSEYDDLLAQLDRRGMRAYLILDYSNPLYEEAGEGTDPFTGKPEKGSIGSPQHPESIAAFATWAAAAAKHFHGRNVIWEIYNEPNGNFWKPKPDANQYAALALATCRAIRQVEPRATIVGPATSGFAWEFMETVCKSGVLEYLDAVSVHPYRPPSRSPESAAQEYQRLRALIDKYAPSGKSIPILSGEWGYSSNTKGVTQQQQANFIARQQLSNLYHGIPLSIWYDWKNDGNNPNENEHNFGTVTSALEPKPAYKAIQILTHELAGYRLNRRLDTGNTNDFVMIFGSGGHDLKVAAWTTGAPHQTAITLNKTSAKEISFINGAGQEGKLDVENGQITVPLEGNPKYIELKGAEIQP